MDRWVSGRFWRAGLRGVREPGRLLFLRVGGHFGWFIAVSMIAVPLGLSLGLVWRRFFACYSVPIISAFVSDDGHAHDNDGHGRTGLGPGMGYLLSLLALAIGALFQFHLMFAAGLLSLYLYSLWADVRLGRGK